MSAASIASNGIVVEVLNRENYSSWKELVRNYLMGKGLWYNIIVGHDIDKEKEKDPEWESRNRRALHVIQLSCGKAIGQIKNFNEAKKAWDHLKTSFSEDVKAYHGARKQTHVAVKILRHHDARQIPLDDGKKDLRPIYALAHVPSAFPSIGAKLGWWEHFIYHKILRIKDDLNERIEIEFHDPDEIERPNIMTHTLPGLGRLFGRFQQFVQTLMLSNFVGMYNHEYS
ncbi:pectinesterase/pectinesterase inhibitor 32 [Spatholobus suberectus]|nr:pectinesterase/pectinesterase inhibitor 32 [Spatholobus suberectus]